MEKKDELLKIFSLKLRTIISGLDIDFKGLQEVRLRINAPLILIYKNQEYFVSETSEIIQDEKNAFIITKNEIRETMEYISNYSMYAFEEEIKQGFITIQGGHRIGIAGKTILESGKVKSIKHISFLNIRISHQIRGCGEKVTEYLWENNTICHTLIISPPGCGKTTLLRDIVRLFSTGVLEHRGVKVGVVDERSEIAACYMGHPQNDLGIRTDVLDCCPKAEGMLMLIRSMSPTVIAVDEVGRAEDITAIEYVINCGCKIFATVHGKSLEDVKAKPVLGKLIMEKLFERYIILENSINVGNIKGIYNADGQKIY